MDPPTATRPPKPDPQTPNPETRTPDTPTPPASREPESTARNARLSSTCKVCSSQLAAGVVQFTVRIAKSTARIEEFPPGIANRASRIAKRTTGIANRTPRVVTIVAGMSNRRTPNPDLRSPNFIHRLWTTAHALGKTGDMSKLRTLMNAHGFFLTGTGGGCTAYSRMDEDGTSWLITKENDVDADELILPGP